MRRARPDGHDLAVAPSRQPRNSITAEPPEQRALTTEPIATPTTAPRDLPDILRSQTEPLFAVLDAARDPQVLAFLQSAGQPYQSLYEGPKGEELAQFAPYLLELPAGSPALETLVREGWGASWGIFVRSRAGFADVRRHFRHFLLVKTEDGREFYFRFYDPRVLRAFLPTCTPQQVAEFFGPVTSYLSEGDDRTTLLQFTRSGTRLTQTATPVRAIP